MLPKNVFVRNVLTLMTGTTIAQAIPIAISPILTRIYKPEDLGLLAIYMSLVSILAVIATFRYELAIILPEKDEEAVNIIALSLIITIGLSFIILIMVWLFNEPITYLLGNPQISNWLYFVPITVFLTGVYQTFNYWSNRKKRYKRLAISKVSQTGTTAAIHLGLGLSGLGIIGLIMGVIFGQGVATCILFFQGWREDKSRKTHINTSQIWKQAKIHKNFPKINMGHSIVDNINNNGTIFLLNYFFSSSIVGYYSLMMRVLYTPVTIIGNAITQVFYQKTADLFNKGENIKPAILKLLIKLVFIALVPTLLLIFFSPSLFAFVFGENWRIAGEYTKILVPYMFFHFLVSPLAFVPLILKKQLQAFLFSLIGNLLYLISIFYAGFNNNLTVGLQSISVLLSIYFIIYIIWIIFESGRKEGNK